MLMASSSAHSRHWVNSSGSNLLRSFPRKRESRGLSPWFWVPAHSASKTRVNALMAGDEPTVLTIGSQVLPVRIFELARDERAEIGREHAQPGIPPPGPPVGPTDPAPLWV